MHPIGPELPISGHVACARVCRQLYVLGAGRTLVQAPLGIGTVIIVYIGVAYTKGGGGIQPFPTLFQVQWNTPLASVPDPVGHRHMLHPEWCTRHADEIAKDIPAKLRQDLQRIRQGYDMGHKLSDAYKTTDPPRKADAYRAADPSFKDMAYDWLKGEKQRLAQQEAELQSRQENMMQLAESTTRALQQVQQQHQTDVQATWHVQHEQMQQSLAVLRSQVAQQQHVLLDFQNLQQERLSALAAKEREAETLLASLKKRESNLLRREELFEDFIRRRLAAEDEAHRILWNQVSVVVLLSTPAAGAGEGGPGKPACSRSLVFTARKAECSGPVAMDPAAWVAYRAQ